MGATIRHHSFKNNCKISLTVSTVHEKAKAKKEPANIDPVYQMATRWEHSLLAPLSH